MFKNLATILLAAVLAFLVLRIGWTLVTFFFVFVGIIGVIGLLDDGVARWRRDRKTRDSIKGSL